MDTTDIELSQSVPEVQNALLGQTQAEEVGMRNYSPLLLDLEDYEEQTGFTFESYIEHLKAQSTKIYKEPIRKYLTKAIKAIVWNKTDGYCYHCKSRLNPFDDFHVDHLIPVSRGGTDDIKNLVPSCIACNLSKGSSMNADTR